MMLLLAGRNLLQDNHFDLKVCCDVKHKGSASNGSAFFIIRHSPSSLQ